MTRPDIRSQTAEALQARLQDWGEPAYRLPQLLHWLYTRRVTDWADMTNLPQSLRAQLAAHFTLHLPALVRQQGAQDTTVKFLWRLADGALIESVLIPANPALYGERSDRHTLCVSTQVGCAYGCKFCASGLKGWKRHLTPHEIVGQVLAVERWHEQQMETARRARPPARAATLPTTTAANRAAVAALPPVGRLIDNLVIMGMGEPLANYEHLLQALRILNAPWGGGIGARKITISTVGLAPQIRRLADELFQFRLAISLHAATDAVRNRIMPINRKYPLAELTAACRYYQQKKGRMITFEYILLAGINDGPEHIPPLVQLARELHARINLIPYNHVPDLPWERPADATCEAFLRALRRHKITATLRREKGHDIDAACGQLRLRTERELATTGVA